MGILECASSVSAWRGYEYYKAKKVSRLEEIETGVFSAIVSGNEGNTYSVELHIDHPRKSKCNCPHANGKKIICKHLVATYFTVLPQEAEKFYTEVIAYQEEEEERAEELADRVYDFVQNMKPNKLRQTLLQILFDGPEWQYERFVIENGLENNW